MQSARAYYNEIDPGAAATLRELIRAGMIAPGEVDERSIEDVQPKDLLGYSQCHFFAGIGVWSYALRLARWPDDLQVWTGSCPCQPFSTAGKGKGLADERHLWPAFAHLIDICGPERVFGEQVAGKDGLAWLDLVSTDLEAMGYACGAVPFPAAGIGAPHIRERLYWLGDAIGTGLEGYRGHVDHGRQPGWIYPPSHRPAAPAGAIGGMENPDSQRLHGINPFLRADDRRGAGDISKAAGRGASNWMDDAERIGRQARRHGDNTWHVGQQLGADGENNWPGPTNGHWRNADWLGCRDRKWRPVEPGTSPLAHGIAGRVGLLRGYGNAIVAQAAQEFIEAYQQVKGWRA